MSKLPNLILGLLFCTLSAIAAPWTHYENSRFGFQMIVPRGLDVVARADDGSGMTWQTGTVRVQVFGANNPYQISASRWFANVQASAGDRIVDQRTSPAGVEPAWHEILYLKDGRRVHRKTFVGGGSINTVEVSYAYKLREEKQPIGQVIVDSLKPGDLSQAH